MSIFRNLAMLISPVAKVLIHSGYCERSKNTGGSSFFIKFKPGMGICPGTDGAVVAVGGGGGCAVVLVVALDFLARLTMGDGFILK